MSQPESEATRRNGGLDVRALMQWLPIVAVVFSAGMTYAGYTSLREETAALRVSRDAHGAALAELTRAQAVSDGRVDRSERDNRAVQDKLERIGDDVNLMNRRIDALCAALGKRCEP